MSLTEIFDIRAIEVFKVILICIIVVVYVIGRHIFHVLISKISIVEILDFREMGPFNSREIALFICVVIPLGIVYYRSSKIRYSIKQVFSSFFVKNIIIVYVLLLLHLIVAIVVLHSIGFWRLSLLKDTTIWLLFSASVTIFNINNADKDKKYFSGIIVNNIKMTAIIEFITGQHTFNIFIEILLTIIGFFIGGLLALSNEEKHKDVKTFLNIIASVLGGIMLYYSLMYIVENMNTFNTAEKSGEFSLPIILSLWFTPFFYILYLYMNYESRFIAMKFAIKADDILPYAKRQAIIMFKTDIESLRRWVNTLFLDEPKTKQAIKDSIYGIKRLKFLEKNPPIVDRNEGWSPYESKDFLKADGVETGFYTKCFDDEWQASSSYIELNSSLIDNAGIYHNANNVAYYVSGNGAIAKQLKLVLHINSKNDEELSIDKFHQYTKSLYKAALDKRLPAAITQSIARRRNKKLKIRNANISIQKHDFVDKKKGYSLIFSIVHE